MPVVDFYYDFRSPFTYFATQRLSLLTDRGAKIVWRPVFVDVLINLQQQREPWDEVLDPLCPPKRAHFMADIFRLIEFWKIPFNIPSPLKPNCNTAMSIAAILEKGDTEHSGFRDAVFKAVWQEQQDANEHSVLSQCLEADQLDVALIEEAQTHGKDLLTENTLSAYERGVFGVPMFGLDSELYFGSDRMELLTTKL